MSNMNHSNSSINCFAACQKKYWHSYINNTKPDIPPSPHLAFGSMAHDVLYQAGILRDNCEAGITDYNIVIPSEASNIDLKSYFNIYSWNRYFRDVCKQVAIYEKDLLKHFSTYEKGGFEIMREHTIVLKASDIIAKTSDTIYLFDNVKGIIDLLYVGKKYAMIIDYKFSTKVKDQLDFDLNSQLQLYALLVSKKYNIPLRNIIIGYIDIPKTEFGNPTLLSTGKLSRSKAQNVSQEMYIKAVKAVHPDECDEMLKPDGYYYNIVQELALKKAAYLSYQFLELDTVEYMRHDMIKIMKTIELCNSGELDYLSKLDAYTCRSCEFLKSCKPWLRVFGGDYND